MSEPHSSPPIQSPLERIVEILRRHEVEFILIGGQAESLFGSPRVTYDTDLCYRRSPDNIRRLADALSELKPTLRGAPPGLPFRADAATIQNGCNFTFDTPLGDLDLLGEVEPIGPYEALLQHAERWSYAGDTMTVIGLDDLIRVKAHVNRPKDRESLAQLQAIKRLRRETGER